MDQLRPHSPTNPHTAPTYLLPFSASQLNLAEPLDRLLAQPLIPLLHLAHLLMSPAHFSLPPLNRLLNHSTRHGAGLIQRLCSPRASGGELRREKGDEFGVLVSGEGALLLEC